MPQTAHPLIPAARTEEETKLKKILVGSLKERDNLKEQSIDERMGSECILGRSAGECEEWIHLAQKRDQWWVLLNVVMNLRVLAPWS
jgi:hypothetical protein